MRGRGRGLFESLTAGVMTSTDPLDSPIARVTLMDP